MTVPTEETGVADEPGPKGSSGERGDVTSGVAVGMDVVVDLLRAMEGTRSRKRRGVAIA